MIETVYLWTYLLMNDFHTILENLATNLCANLVFILLCVESSCLQSKTISNVTLATEYMDSPIGLTYLPLLAGHANPRLYVTTRSVYLTGLRQKCKTQSGCGLVRGLSFNINS